MGYSTWAASRKLPSAVCLCRETREALHERDRFAYTDPNCEIAIDLKNPPAKPGY